MTIKFKQSNFVNLPLTQIILVSLILTVVVGFAVVIIQKTYFNNYSYFFDPISYSFKNVLLHEQLSEKGRWALAWQEWLDNNRNPLRTIPLILFKPDLLAHPLGHLATSIPFFFIFLILLGWTIYQRTNSIFYSVACIFLFCSISSLYSPTFGLAPYWLDLTASLILGCAFLCLLNYAKNNNLKWLIAFSIFAGLTALSRYIAFAYLVFSCYPLFFFCLFKQWQKEENLHKSILIPLIIHGLTTGIIAGYFLLAHLADNIFFYTNYGYALNKGFLFSFLGVVRFVFDYFGQSMFLLILTIIFVVYLILLGKKLTQNWLEIIITFSGSFFISTFLILVIKVDANAARHSVLYLIPLLFLAIFSPLPIPKKLLKSKKNLLKYVAITLIIISILLGSKAIIKNYQYSQNPNEKTKKTKLFEKLLAKEVAKQGDSTVWNIYFHEYTWIPTMEAFYNHQTLALPAGGRYFHAHKTAWLTDYSNLSPEEITTKIYDASKKWVKLAVVLKNPSDANKITILKNDYSVSIAKSFAEKIHKDSLNWQKVFILESPWSDVLVEGYLNQNYNPQAYDFILWGNASKIDP